MALAEHQLDCIRLHERQVRQSLPLHFLRRKDVDGQLPATRNSSVAAVEENTAVDVSVYWEVRTRIVNLLARIITVHSRRKKWCGSTVTIADEVETFLLGLEV